MTTTKINSRHLIVLVLIATLIANCSAVYGGSTSSEGNISIIDTPTEINFSGSINSTSYRRVSFSNQSQQSYRILSLAFKDNGCGAFSLVNVTDGADNLVYEPGSSLSIDVTPGSSVSFNIRFNPEACEITEYSTSFLIYYQEADKVRVKTTIFNVSISGDVIVNPDDNVECSEDTRSFYDEFNNPTKRTLTPLESEKPYYLKIKKMSAYIQTTGGFSNFATQVGTAINLDKIPEENRFEPIFIPLVSRDNNEIGTLDVEPITKCTGFILPSPITDQFFIGATSTITTSETFMGTIDRRVGSEGKIDVPGLVINLKSFINNSNSLLQNEQGQFEVNVSVDLTSGSTDYFSYLEELVDLKDDDDQAFLNIQNGQLVGKNLRHGTLTLVGVGRFIDDDSAKMSGEAVQGILENEAYLFIQMEALVTQEITTGSDDS